MLQKGYKLRHSKMTLELPSQRNCLTSFTLQNFGPLKTRQNNLRPGSKAALYCKANRKADIMTT